MALFAVAMLNRTWRAHEWKGWLHGVRDAGDDWTRLGQTGPGSQTTHRQAPQSVVIVTQVCSTISDALSAAWQAEGWERSVIPLVDDKGVNWDRVFVRSVRASVKGCRGNGPSGQAGAKTVVELTLEVLDDG